MSDKPTIWPRLQLAENFTVKFAPGGAIRIEQLQDGIKVDIWLEPEHIERLVQEVMHQAQQRAIGIAYDESSSSSSLSMAG